MDNNTACLPSNTLKRLREATCRAPDFSRFVVISAYPPRCVSSFCDTTDVLATVEELLDLGKLSKFDHYGRALRDVFTVTPDLSPYVALKSEQPLDELNPPKTPTAHASLELDLDRVDAADEDAFNRILWTLLKGSQSYPGTKRMSSREMVRAQ